MVRSVPLSLDSIVTVSTPVSVSTLVLGSKFIVFLTPSLDEESFGLILRDRIRRYPDASHHCWAIRTSRPGPLIEKSSDDGEPSGTAGRPILDALRSARLENVGCVVTRYFGGTRLGTGGLVRAYGDAATMAISAAQIETRDIRRAVRLCFPHTHTGVVYRGLEEFGVTLRDVRYEENVAGLAYVPPSRVDGLRARLTELSRTGIEWTEGELIIQ